MLGYDNYRPNQELLLDLPFREAVGTLTADWAKPYHAGATLTGPPTWAALGNDLSYLSFNPATPDRIIISAANCTDLGFTADDFSGAMWIYPDVYGNRYVFDKSSATAGWAFWIVGTSPYLAFTTANAGPATQTTYGAAGLALAEWQLIGFTRIGAAVQIYLNGLDRTVTSGTHIDPAASAAIDLTIGTADGGGAGWYDGRMWRPRIWKRGLTASEWLMLYEGERSLFGV
ncbi:MAG: LamG domain-containing protein [Planctomycetes bacterium]|nr:LamG domain-containing protein [Planctomycetota bacterium]